MKTLPIQASPVRNPDRRTVLKTAAWTTPAVVIATAAPAFAVSPTDPAVDAYATVTDPREPQNGMSGASKVYTGGPSVRLTFDATYGNNGPNDIPAGAVLMFGLGAGAFWDTITLDSAVWTHNSSAASTAFIDTYHDPLSGSGPNGTWTSTREWVRYTLLTPLPVGTSVKLIFSAHLRTYADAQTTGGEVWSTTGVTTYPNVKARARINLSGMPVTDSNTSNNFSDNPTFLALNSPV